MRVPRDCDLKEFIADTTDKSSGCWILPGSRADNYRLLYLGKGKTVSAHRLSYSVWNGPLLPDLVIMHSCDNKPCCNPEHLEQGTKSQNTRDLVARGLRPKKYIRHHPDLPYRVSSKRK